MSTGTEKLRSKRDAQQTPRHTKSSEKRERERKNLIEPSECPADKVLPSGLNAKLVTSGSLWLPTIGDKCFTCSTSQGISQTSLSRNLKPNDCAKNGELTQDLQETKLTFPKAHLMLYCSWHLFASSCYMCLSTIVCLYVSYEIDSSPILLFLRSRLPPSPVLL